jgi:1-acyl-sn-glycerol-3-phosphate acyltransferase
LFPEGTRARDARLAAFKPGLGMLVAETPIPVVPCYLEGTWQALSPQHKFPRPKKIIVHIGQPLSFLAVKNDRSGWQEIAGAAQAAVESLQPKYG